MTPGSQTTEFKLTLLAQLVGIVAEAAAAVLHTLQDAGHAAPWFPAVLVAVGLVLQVVTLLGYQKSRTLVKAATVQAEAPTQPGK